MYVLERVNLEFTLVKKKKKKAINFGTSLSYDVNDDFADMHLCCLHRYNAVFLMTLLIL